jgi:hypothetical protein
MMNLVSVVGQLKKERDRAAKEVQQLDAALAALNGSKYGNRTGRGTMSAAGRARIAAAQRARWAKVKASNNQSGNRTAAPKRTMSAAARRKIAAAQRARWVRVRAGKKAAAKR